MTHRESDSSSTSVRSYAHALSDMAWRYEQLVRGLSILRQIDALDDVALPPEEICAGLLKTIADNLQVESCALLLLDDAGERLELWAVADWLEDSPTGRAIDPGSRPSAKFGEGAVWRAVATGRPVRSDGVDDCVAALGTRTSHPEARSVLCFPLKAPAGTMGVIHMVNSRRGSFGHDAERIMELVADRCARLLASHRLHSVHRETQKYYRMVCDNAGDGILVFARDGRVVMTNAVAAQVLGVKIDALIDAGEAAWLNAVIEEDRSAVIISRTSAFDSPEPFTIEYRVRDRTGAIRHLEERSSAVLGADGYPARRVCLVRDVTERKRAEENRQKLEAQLRHAQKMEALGELAGGITHDFNNLLTGILANSSMGRSCDDVVEMRELLADIEKAAHRASALTRQLLAMSRRSQPPRRPTGIAPLLAEIADLTRKTFDRRIHVTADASRDLRLVLADPGHVHQVLLNLCVNARDTLLEKATAGHTMEMHIRLRAKNVVLGEAYCQTHAEAKPGEYVQIDVEDTGTGIAPETQARMFEPFFTTKGTSAGTGLGLAITYGIVKQHGGWIAVDSAVGSGTTFQVFLPAIPANTSETSSLPPQRDLRGGRETVLLVDDDEMVRKVARRALERVGYAVMLANDGKECIDIYRRESSRIALVILDLCMPELSGDEVLRQIRTIAPAAKIILSSGHTDSEPPDLAGLFAPSAYLRKPYSDFDITMVVRRVLDERMPPHASACATAERCGTC